MTKMRIDGKEISNANVFEIVAEHFPDIIHSVDGEGNIVFTNRKAESLLGYSQDELLSMNIRQIYADEILDKVEEGFNQLKRKGEKTIIESTLKDRDGNRIPVEIRSFGIYDDDGKFLRTFSIIRDIREIKELQNTLIHAGRLAAIGEMASGIAHDIKNPLNVLFLTSELAMLALNKMAEPKSESMEKLKKSLEGMEKALQMIEKLSEHLSNFSRGVAEQYEVVDLHSIIADSLFIAQNKIKMCAVTTQNKVEKGHYFTKGAPNQLKQVFVNLITNACDAMAETKGRPLTLSISPFKRDGMGYWKCDVSDTGIGIPQDALESVFQSFFTTKEKGKGTGLGLSISRGIIKNHEGDIEVHSEQGKGTTFSVYLPRAEYQKACRQSPQGHG